jgi:hypothetical protein
MSSKMAGWAESVVEARFLVASLGEEASPPWWRTHATSPTGMRMLERLFPRTFVTAGLETASRAASIEHDVRIGRVGAYHLFRFPTAEEAALRDFLRTEVGRRRLENLVRLEGADTRLRALAGLAGDESEPTMRGPVNCGSVTTLLRGPAFRRLCAAYMSGLRAGSPVYPYLEQGSA